MDNAKFKQGLQTLGITAGDTEASKFAAFEELLLDWNKKINLTSITGSFEIMTKHFFDSLLPLAYKPPFCPFPGRGRHEVPGVVGVPEGRGLIPQGAAVIDVGTGAGFPGIPLKILRPDISLTLLDALNKRVKFLEEVTARLELADTTCLHGRAEELCAVKKGGGASAFREKFDAAVSRAVASLDVLCELCLPYVKVGGIFLAYKSAGAAEEISAAKPMTGNLGGKIEAEFETQIPFTDITRKIVMIRKVKSTPAVYPRAMGRIKNG